MLYPGLYAAGQVRGQPNPETLGSWAARYLRWHPMCLTGEKLLIINKSDMWHGQGHDDDTTRLMMCLSIRVRLTVLGSLRTSCTQRERGTWVGGLKQEGREAPVHTDHTDTLPRLRLRTFDLSLACLSCQSARLPVSQPLDLGKWPGRIQSWEMNSWGPAAVV